MIDKSPARIRAMFDQISPWYDFLNHLLSLNADILWRRRAAARLAGARRVLDLCSGTGDLAFEAHRRGGGRVVGADFSTRMLRIGLAKARRRRLDDAVHFQAGDALRLPYRDGSFDACTVAFGIRNVLDARRALGEMARVLRPGGRVVVLEFTRPRNAVLRAVYLLYMSRVLPRIGRMIARSEIDAYQYLPDSVARWSRPEELKTKMEECGLGEVTYELLFAGIAAIHTGTKASSRSQP